MLPEKNRRSVFSFDLFSWTLAVISIFDYFLFWGHSWADRQHGLRGKGSAEAVGMPGGAAEDIPVCFVLGTASVMAIEKKTLKKKGEALNVEWLCHLVSRPCSASVSSRLLLALQRSARWQVSTHLTTRGHCCVSVSSCLLLALQRSAQWLAVSAHHKGALQCQCVIMSAASATEVCQVTRTVSAHHKGALQCQCVIMCAASATEVCPVINLYSFSPPQGGTAVSVSSRLLLALQRSAQWLAVSAHHKGALQCQWCHRVCC